MATLVGIDVINKTIPSLNHENIPIINKPNPCYGYMANAKEVKQLIQMPNYWIYEAGTKIVISGNNYYDYFPEESGIPESVSKEEIQKMIDDSVPEVDSVISTTSTNAIQNSAITNFVNSSVSTNTANYIGLFNSVEELNAYTGTVTNNDYAFVVGEDESGNTKYDRYKWTEETSGWLMEYTLNNSSFTSEEWAAIQSGIKSQDVEQIKKNEEDISNLSTNKADKTELVGKNVTGTKYTINGTEYTAGDGAEIFNNYSGNKAVGIDSHAEGGGTIALGSRSHAEGHGTTASGMGAHAEGTSTETKGDGSHAEGGSTKASGNYSHAEGGGTTATGYCSHTEGEGTTASGKDSHSEGYLTTALGQYSHAEGYSLNKQSSVISITSSTTNDSIISAWNSKKFSLAKGNYSHVEGSDCLALGTDSHAGGHGTKAVGDYSYTEGQSSVASGLYSHAEGTSTTASGSYSHAEGGGTTASETGSHAEGSGTKASGSYSHAEGGGTTASGSCSHAEGNSTKASSNNQHVQGKYNIEDTEGAYAFIIGNGTSDTERSNAFAIDWEGKIWQGNSSIGVQVSQNVDLTLEEYEALSDEEKNNGTYYNIIES